MGLHNICPEEYELPPDEQRADSLLVGDELHEGGRHFEGRATDGRLSLSDVYRGHGIAVFRVERCISAAHASLAYRETHRPGPCPSDHPCDPLAPHGGPVD